MPKQQETMRTREQAAARILDLSGYLSSSRFIHRPFDQTVRTPVVGELEEIMRGLSRLGYEPNSSAQQLLLSALSVFSKAPLDGPTPFSTLISASKLLLDSTLSLSTSASPFPLSNQHLPNEILYLILDHVKADSAIWRRRITLHSLIATSLQWRRIALPTSQSQLIITSYQELKECLDGRTYLKILPPTNTLDLVHIDLSDECGRDLKPESSWKVHRRFKVKQLTLDLTMDSNFVDDWFEWASNWLMEVASFTLKLAGDDEDEYRRAARAFFGEFFARSYDRMEFYLGRKPIITSSGLVEGRLSESLEVYPVVSNLPRFMDYSILSTPWLAFTVPAFLLEPIATGLLPEDGDLDIPPSRLEHLELTLEFDPSDPAEALRQVDVFFTTVSPKLETLAIRLRLTSPHPSAVDETRFTDHFIDGLRSCSKLDHLEIGGFGLSADYLARLIRLPVVTLIILPILPLPSLIELRTLVVSTPGLSTSGLKALSLQKTDEQMSSEEHKMLHYAYKAVGVTLRTDLVWQRGWQSEHADEDYEIVLKLANEARVA